MKEIIVGTLFILTLGLVLYFSFTLGGPGSLSALLGERPQEYRVEFAEVTGLKPNSEVLVSGITKGSVTDIRLKQDGNVLVIVEIAGDVEIYQDASAEMIQNSVLGGRAIAINPGTLPAGGLTEDSDVVIPGTYVPDFLTAAGRAVDKIDTVLDNAVTATEDLVEVIADIKAGRGTAGLLLRDQELSTSLSSMVANLEDASRDSKKILSEIERLTIQLNSGEGLLSSVMYSEELARDIKDTAENLRNMSARGDQIAEELKVTAAAINKGDGTVNYLLHDKEGADELKRFMENGDETLKEIQGAANEAKTLLTNVNKGQGSVGKIFTQDTLYNDLVRAINTLQAGFEDLRESAPVTTFASVVFSVFQ